MSILILIISGSCLLYSIFAFGNPDHKKVKIDCHILTDVCLATGGTNMTAVYLELF